MRLRRLACRLADHAAVVPPADPVDDIGRVTRGRDEKNTIAAVGQAVTDAAVVGVGRGGDRCWRAAPEQHRPCSGGQVCHWKLEPPADGRVIIAEPPAGDVDGVGTGVAQLDELVGVGLSLAIAVGVARQAGRWIGEYFTDKDVDGLREHVDGDAVSEAPAPQAGHQRTSFHGGNVKQETERVLAGEPAGGAGHRRRRKRQGGMEGGDPFHEYRREIRVDQ